MKKLATLVMGMAAVCALVACNSKGTEVKAEEFQEKAAKIEGHQYSQATVKYSVKSEYKVPNFGDTGPLDDETGPLNESGEATFTFSDGEWTTKDEKAYELVGETVGISLKDADFNFAELTAEYEQMAKAYGISSSLKYFVNPFGVEFTAKGDIKDEATSSTGKLDVDEYIAFDNYGFINKLDVKADVSGSTKVGEKTYESKIFTEIHVTISYK